LAPEWPAGQVVQVDAQPRRGAGWTAARLGAAIARLGRRSGVV